MYSTLVKTPLLPAGINPPENEKPSIVVPPVDTLNPASSAKPPEAAPRSVPVISIWKPPTSTGVSIVISIEVSPTEPKPKATMI